MKRKDKILLSIGFVFAFFENVFLCFWFVLWTGMVLIYLMERRVKNVCKPEL